jgi:diaminohydroxyphosphoribosylaminopyrimidine deaminase/5-amino-6-(5-phosphoribosylamino)uracil reductase
MAMLDPFPQVAGQGLARLQHANIQTLVGVQELAAQELNAPYLKRILQKTPWVIAKWAMSLDGRIATRTGHSQWISNEQSRQYVQQLRGRVDAVLVGIGTALADNPRLTPRTEAPPPRIPLRVVIDSQARLPATSQLATTANQSPVLIWSGPNANGDNVQRLRSQGCELVISSDGEPNQRLHTLLQTLVKDYGVTNLLVEGGGAILGSLLELKQIDECEVFIAPKLIGGSQAYAPIAGLGIDQLTDGPQVASHAVATLGDDVHVRCRFNWNRKP